MADGSSDDNDGGHSDAAGSVSLAIRDAKIGNLAAGEEVLRLICTRKHYWDRLQSIASKHNVMPADRDHFVNEALQRLYNGLVLNKYRQVSNRESLFRLIGGIVRKCVSEAYRHERGKRKSAVRATQALPENQIDNAPGPGELAQLRDGFAVFRDRLEAAVPNPVERRKHWRLLELRIEEVSEKEIRIRLASTATEIKKMEDLMRNLMERPDDDSGP